MSSSGNILKRSADAIELDSSDEDSASEATMNSSNTTADVWQWYDAYQKGSPNFGVYACCKLCDQADIKRNVKYGGSTTKLRRHMLRWHAEVWKEHATKKAKAEQGSRNILAQFLNKKSSEERFLEHYIRWMVHTYQPFNTCNNHWFREMCMSLNAKAPIIDRARVTAEITNISVRVKVLITQRLHGEHVALTTDDWTSCANESYLALTAHWITNNWELKSVTLSCQHHTGAHSGVAIADLVSTVWQSYEIPDESIQAIVTDTYSVMNSAGLHWGDHYNVAHHYCVDHVLELTTGLAFKDENIPGAEDTMRNARHLVGHFKRSPQAAARLLSVQPDNDRKVGVIEDVATRWWSTYQMCERLLRLRPYFTILVLQGHLACNLNDHQWQIVTSVSTLLQPFMVFQKIMEGQKYVTVSLVPHAINKLRRGMNDFIAHCNDASLTTLSTKMLLDFQVRWGEGLPGTVFHENETRGRYNRQKGIPIQVLLAAALDPRMKSLGCLPGPDQILVWDHITVLLQNLVHVNEEPIQNAPIEHEHEPDDGFFADLALPPAVPIVVVQVQQEEQDALLVAELNRYRAAAVLPMKTKPPEGSAEIPKHNNPLDWWREKAVLYPHVALLARRLLCIPAGSAPSERVFSQAGLTIANARAGLLPEHAADLVFLHGAMEEAELLGNIF